VKTDGHNVQRSSTTKDLSTQRSDLVVCTQTVSVSTWTKGTGRRFSDLLEPLEERPAAARHGHMAAGSDGFCCRQNGMSHLFLGMEHAQSPKLGLCCLRVYA